MIAKTNLWPYCIFPEQVFLGEKLLSFYLIGFFFFLVICKYFDG